MSRATLALCVVLNACGGTDSPSDSGATLTDPVPADLCVASSCGTKTQLLSIPQAENIFFTPDGRMFVSGSTNVFEITHPGNAYKATPIFDGTGNFGGMAQRSDVLYVTNFTDGSLYATQLTAQPALQKIHTLHMASPNGMAAGPDGELYINNGPLSTSSLPDPRMVRIRIDANDPMKVIEQTNWLTHDLSFPNGLARAGRSLFFTDSTVLPPTLGLIKRVDINDDGSPGAVTTIATFTSLPDDLSVVGDALLVAFYSGGAIALFKQDGTLISQTDPLSFEFPSQVKLARSPIFGPTDIVVTEKGVVGDDITPLGDKLSVFRHH
jgi:hypothetical protein